MKLNNSILSYKSEWVRILIACFLGYFLGLAILKFSHISVTASYLVIILLLFLLARPKYYVYFIVVLWAFMPVLYFTGRIMPGGMTYFSANIGGAIKVFGFVFGIVFLMLRKESVAIFKYRLTLPMFLYMGMTLVGLLMCDYKFWALRAFVRAGMAAVLYLLILQLIKDFDEGKKMLWLSLIFFVPVIGYGYWDMFIGTGVIGLPDAAMAPISEQASGVATPVFEVFRVGGIYHALGYGTTLVFFMILSVFFYFESRHSYRWLYFVMFANMLILLVKTYARASWGEFIAAMFILGVLRYRKFLFVFLLLGAVSLMVFSHEAQLIMMRWINTDTLSSRLDIWGKVWEGIRESPIFGNGYGAVQLFFFDRMSFAAKTSVAATATYGIKGHAAHNDYVRLLAEGGIVYLGIFFFLIYRGIKLSYDLYKSTNSTIKSYGAVLFAVIVVILLDGITTHGFNNWNHYFWVFAAIGELYFRKQQDLPQEKD